MAAERVDKFNRKFETLDVDNIRPTDEAERGLQARLYICLHTCLYMHAYTHVCKHVCGRRGLSAACGHLIHISLA